MIARLAARLRRLRAWPAVVAARRVTAERLAGGPMSRLLIVCHGNIYRSAFVGEHLRGLLQGRAEVRSAGFYPKSARPAPPRHVEMSRARGVALEGHASRVVSAADLDWADTIVLMDRRNWLELRAAHADARKLVWLGALLPGPVEIADPYAMDDAAAAALLDRLSACGTRLAEVIAGTATAAPRETTDAGRRG